MAFRPYNIVKPLQSKVEIEGFHYQTCRVVPIDVAKKPATCWVAVLSHGIPAYGNRSLQEYTWYKCRAKTLLTNIHQQVHDRCAEALQGEDFVLYCNGKKFSSAEGEDQDFVGDTRMMTVADLDMWNDKVIAMQVIKLSELDEDCLTGGKTSPMTTSLKPSSTARENASNGKMGIVENSENARVARTSPKKPKIPVPFGAQPLRSIEMYPGKENIIDGVKFGASGRTSSRRAGDEKFDKMAAEALKAARGTEPSVDAKRFSTANPRQDLDRRALPWLAGAKQPDPVSSVYGSENGPQKQISNERATPDAMRDTPDLAARPSSSLSPLEARSSPHGRALIRDQDYQMQRMLPEKQERKKENEDNERTSDAQEPMYPKRGVQLTYENESAAFQYYKEHFNLSWADRVESLKYRCDDTQMEQTYHESWRRTRPYIRAFYWDLVESKIPVKALKGYDPGQITADVVESMLRLVKDDPGSFADDGSDGRVIVKSESEVPPSSLEDTQDAPKPELDFNDQFETVT